VRLTKGCHSEQASKSITRHSIYNIKFRDMCILTAI
jgi:hypothetical protein